MLSPKLKSSSPGVSSDWKIIIVADVNFGAYKDRLTDLPIFASFLPSLRSPSSTAAIMGSSYSASSSIKRSALATHRSDSLAASRPAKVSGDGSRPAGSYCRLTFNTEALQRRARPASFSIHP